MLNLCVSTHPPTPTPTPSHVVDELQGLQHGGGRHVHVQGQARLQ